MRILGIIKSIKRQIASLLIVLLVLPILPLEKLGLDGVLGGMNAHASIVVGNTGNITNNVGLRGSGGGIDREVFLDPGALIAIYRDIDFINVMEDESEITIPLCNKLIAPLYVFTDRALSEVDKLVIGKAVGDTSLVGEVPDRVIWRTPRKTNPVGTNGIYYDAIKDNYGNLGNWQTYINANRARSKQAWEYILDTSDYGAARKIGEVFKLDFEKLGDNDGLNAAEKKELWLRYLDLLMSIYALSEGNGSQYHWGIAINDFVTNNNLEDNPVHIVLEPATLLKVYGQGHIAISWINYMNFYAAASNTYAIDKQPWREFSRPASVKGSAYREYQESIRMSINESPQLQRISRIYTESNPWSHGVSAITWERFTTNNNDPRYTRRTQETRFALAETMWLRGETKGKYEATWGSMGVMMPSFVASVEPIGRMVASPKNTPVETNTIGVPVTLEIYSGVGDKEKRDWESVISEVQGRGEDFKIVITDLVRTSAQKPGNGVYVPSTPYTQTMTPEEFRSWLNEENSIQIVDEDVIGINVNRGSDKNITFNYTCRIAIQYGNKNVSNIVKTISDAATFVVLPERIGYTSKPEAYAEIKNYGAGSNMNGNLREEWEAMAGIPSTEQLYFAAGGSEFIVDVSLEYTPGEKAVRAYNSYYTKTECQNKVGDQAKSYTVPSPSGASSSKTTIHVHNGDLVVTATWTGQIPNKATAVTNLHSATCPAQPDRTAYNTAKNQANAWVSALNSHTISHTSVSDKRKRDYRLSASITTDTAIDPVTTTASVPCQARPAGPEGNPPAVPCGNEMATANPSGPGSYTITVRSTVPHHVICGPCCSHDLPEIHDTWRQTFEYDSMRITDVHVWEMTQAAVNGMQELIGVDVVNAEVRVGEPTVFYNIAVKNRSNYTSEANNKNRVNVQDRATYSSESGRIRYKVSPEQHDTVNYALGVRSNRCDGMSNTYSTNVSPNGGGGHTHAWATGLIYNTHIGSPSVNGHYFNTQAGNRVYPVNTVGYLQANTSAKDKATPEYAEFLKKRRQPQTATMITDFLILQTSNGDQSVMYYHQTTPQGSITAEHEIPTMKVTKETMWDNNPNSAAKWKEDHINVGGYNGNFRSETNKFRVNNKGNSVNTLFEPDPATGGTPSFTIVRSPKPTRNLMLYSNPLNIILRNSNKSYRTGRAEVFWENLVHWTDVSSSYFTTNPSPAPFNTNTTIGPITGYNFRNNAKTNNDRTNFVRSRPIPESLFRQGITLHAPYSKDHSKVNDLIIHDPVSAQSAVLISLPDSRDQRTNNTGGAAQVIAGINNSQTCPGEPGLCDFRHLINGGNCNFFRNTLVLDMDFDTRDPAGNPINKVSGNSIQLPSGYSIVGAPSGSGMNGRVLRTTASSPRMSIPFSELGLTYSRSLRLRVEADLMLDSGTSNQMLFSFHRYDAYLVNGYNGVIINTGNGVETHHQVSGVNLRDGKRHRVRVDFSMANTDRTDVYINGVKATSTRHNTSRDIDRDLVGNSISIGSWGVNNNYPIRGYIDNFKITKLAGTSEHTEDCYTLRMTHPNGLNFHRHSQSCLNGRKSGANYVSGAEWLVQEFGKGNLTEQQLRDILGPAYNPIMANSFGPVIHTWSNWTTANMYGFHPMNHVTLSAVSGNLRQVSSGNDPHFNVPVDFTASGVTKIDVVLDNATSSNTAQLYWERNNSSGYTSAKSVTAPMLPNTNNQVVSFIVRNHAQWNNIITSLRFDLGNTTGTTTVRRIEVYGAGNRVSSGSGAGTVVWQSGTPGQHNFNASAGSYTLEVWGAQGGTGAGGGTAGGRGGYAKGDITLSAGETMRIFVGGHPTNRDGGFNGGGRTYSSQAGAGGGATDVRIGGTAFSSRVIVAGGGGGSQYRAGGHGGGATGGNGVNGYGSPGLGGTQTAGGGGPNSGSLGQGGNSVVGGDGYGGGAGGGGYYGGGGGSSDHSIVDDSGGGGGSGYIGGVQNGQNIAGNASMPNPSGGTMTGRAGHGYARITSNFTPVKIDGAGGASSGQVFNYSYTGSVQSVALPAGRYRLETWGAQGGTGGGGTGGLGGYARGEVTLSSAQTLRVYVGGAGGADVGGWNGGGSITSTLTTNGGGGGGGTDIRMGGTALTNRIIVAGGGGGATCPFGTAYNGGAGGGLAGLSGNGSVGATQSSGGTGYGAGGLGVGGSGRRHGGAGGGGYYGGGGSNDCATSGSGGSSYIAGLASAQTIGGNGIMPNPSGGNMAGRTGHGYARITALDVAPVVLITADTIRQHWELIPDKLPNGTNNPIFSCNRAPNVHICDSACVNVAVLNCTEPHHKGLHYDVSNPICWEACNDDAAHKNYKPVVNTADGSYTPGNFINIDWGFQVYFPNIGDFNQSQPYGLGALTSTRGRGFVDGMDTTKWTRVKRIKFNINVIYKNQLYVAGEWITLSDYGNYNGADGAVYDERNWSNYGTELFNDVRGNLINGSRNNTYQFYAVLANHEMKASEVMVDVEAVNSRGENDNYNTTTNRVRTQSFTALHGATNNFYMDVVGRIGNLTLQDTTDYRFSNLLKTPIEERGSTVNDPKGVLDIPELKTMEFGGATWARVLYQDISNNTNYFTSSNYLDVNRHGLFSALGRLDDFKTGDKFEFLLRYPDSYGIFAGAYNRWRQTTNPLNQLTNGGSSAGPHSDAIGYEPIHIDMPGYAGRGLEFNGSAAVLDGTVGFGNWWLAVGIMNNSYGPTNSASKPYTMPGPHNGTSGQGVSQVELWVRVDDILYGGSGEVTKEQSNYGVNTLKNNVSGNTTTDSRYVNLESSGARVGIPNGLLRAGQYRIDVTGRSLGNGKLYANSNVQWTNFGIYDRSHSGITYSGSASSNNLKLEGPNVDLPAGKYRMTVHGSGFTMANFVATSDGGLLNTDAEYKEDATITYYFELDKTTRNIGIKTSFSEVIQDFVFEKIVIDQLEEGVSVDMVENGHVSRIVETSSEMSYYLTVPADSTVSLGWTANNNRGLSVENIVVTRLGDHAEGWIIDNIVKKVDETKQNHYLTWQKDIRGVNISNQTNWLNTYGTSDWADGNILKFPLSPSQNNISILRDEPMLPGYDLLLDISTIGNYYRNNSSLMQVMSYYYALNVNTGELTPVDVYMKLDSSYVPVNLFNNYNSNGSLKMPIYNYIVNLDWVNEAGRRNYTAVEQMQTDFFRTKFAEGGPSTDSSGFVTGDGAGEPPAPYKQLDAPAGSFHTLGNAQILQTNGRARTFIGGETTYGTLMNLGGTNTIRTDSNNNRKYNPSGRVVDFEWWAAAQRWHFKVGVPSSSVFVRHDSTQSFNPSRVITNDMVEEFKTSDYIILATADIMVVGEIYALKYDHENDNGSIRIRKKDGSWSSEWRLPTNIPPVLAVYSAELTTEYDISITKTH